VPQVRFGEPGAPVQFLMGFCWETDYCRVELSRRHLKPNSLLVLTANRLHISPALAHMTYVVGCIHLDLKSVWIVELEGFF
jgi:hypothetical protein